MITADIDDRAGCIACWMRWGDKCGGPDNCIVRVLVDCVSFLRFLFLLRLCESSYYMSISNASKVMSPYILSLQADETEKKKL